MDKFAGSIAIVTGGSAGIGKALIKRLLEKSSDLTVIGSDGYWNCSETN
jgi:NAD(P)-dependent dehydrogenase (short-subunit alcohol dehydrogenase family)